MAQNNRRQGALTHGDAVKWPFQSEYRTNAFAVQQSPVPVRERVPPRPLARQAGILRESRLDRTSGPSPNRSKGTQLDESPPPVQRPVCSRPCSRVSGSAYRWTTRHGGRLRCTFEGWIDSVRTARGSRALTDADPLAGSVILPLISTRDRSLRVVAGSRDGIDAGMRVTATANYYRRRRQDLTTLSPQGGGTVPFDTGRQSTGLSEGGRCMGRIQWLS